jgi:tripartite-type tricarboxylate transporter receptor subunit TctC
MRPRLAGLLLCACAFGSALAQDYPSRPVHMAVGIAPGGGLDGGARLVASKLSELLGQQFIVENRPGAGGTIAAATVAKAPADGYMLLFAATTLLIAPAIYDNLPFDPIRSFAPIGLAGTELITIAVHPAVPARTAAELIALLKANPGKYSYGTPGVGTVHHLAAELFKKQAGVDMVHVPYKGAALIIPDILNGTLPVAVMSVTSALPQAKAGRIRVVALTSQVKLASAPDWPPLADTLPGFDAAPARFVLAPAGTPAQVIARLSEALKTAVAMEDVQRIFLAQGTTSEYITPAALAVRMQAEVVKWGTVAKESGAKPE